MALPLSSCLRKHHHLEIYSKTLQFIEGLLHAVDSFKAHLQGLHIFFYTLPLQSTMAYTTRNGEHPSDFESELEQALEPYHWATNKQQRKRTNRKSIFGRRPSLMHQSVFDETLTESNTNQDVLASAGLAPGNSGQVSVIPQWTISDPHWPSGDFSIPSDFNFTSAVYVLVYSSG